jgi:hypothetical protein
VWGFTTLYLGGILETGPERERRGESGDPVHERGGA